MDFIRNFPLFTILFSLFSGVLCMLLSGRAARRYTLAFDCVLIALVSAVLFYTVRTGSSFTYVMGEFPAPWGNEIRAGILEAFTGLVFLVILLCSLVAGIRYLKIDIDESKENYYFSLINLLTAALMAILWTNDLFTGYVFLEILTLTSCGILIVREIGRTTLAAVRYMLLNLLGSGLFLLGVVLIYDVTGNLLMVPIRAEIAELAGDPGSFVVLTMAAGILSLGLAIKSGLFPFHYWMPDTYGWATPSSASILSSITSKCYIFLLIKIYWRALGIAVFEDMPVKRILFVLGLCAVVFGSVSALRASTINQMVAFSSAAQIGYIFLGIGIGGVEGYTAAVFQILAHSVSKSLLFLTTPRLAEVSENSLKFSALQGSGVRDRTSGVFFLAGALSMIGIPVFAGFSAKLLISTAAVESGNDAVMVLVIFVLAISSMLNAYYFLRTTIRLFHTSEGTVRLGFRGRPDYTLPILILIGCNLCLGLLSEAAAELIHRGLFMMM